MKYSVKVSEVNSDKTNVKGFASVVMNDCFKVSNIAIVQNKEGELFVSMPSYRSNEVDEYNQTVYKDICNPITAECNKEMNQAILTAFEKRKELGNREYVVGEAAPNLDFNVKVKPFKRDGSNLRGLGRVYFEDAFVVQNVSILQGKNGVFVSMPSYKTKQERDGKAVYQDICYPVTKEFREKLYGAIVDCYQQEKEKAVTQAEQVSQNASSRESVTEKTEELPFR